MKGSLDTELLMNIVAKPQLLAPGSTSPTGIDCKGYDEALVILQAAGAGVDDNGTIALAVTESDDDSSYSAITGAALAASAITSIDNKLYVGRLDMRRRKRYLKVAVTAAVSSIDIASQLALGKKNIKPVANTNEMFDITNA